MSVIVKGMEMPENCWECTGVGLNVSVSVFGGMCPYCEKIRTDHDMETGRHPECPLVALPDKHGDLIDRDALRAKFHEPKDMIDPQQALVHITGVWAEIDCADVVIEAEEES